MNIATVVCSTWLPQAGTAFATSLGNINSLSIVYIAQNAIEMYIATGKARLKRASFILLMKGALFGDRSLEPTISFRRATIKYSV